MSDAKLSCARSKFSASALTRAMLYENVGTPTNRNLFCLGKKLRMFFFYYGFADMTISDLTGRMECFPNPLDSCPCGKEPIGNVWRAENPSEQTENQLVNLLSVTFKSGQIRFLLGDSSSSNLVFGASADA